VIFFGEEALDAGGVKKVSKNRTVLLCSYQHM